MRRGLEVCKDAVPEDSMEDSSDDVFGVGLIGEDVDAERRNSSLFHGQDVGCTLSHVARRNAELEVSIVSPSIAGLVHDVF